MNTKANKDNNEKKLIKNALKVLWIVFALPGFIFVLIQVDRLISKDFVSASKHILLKDNWDITINDDAYHDVSLDDFSFQAVNKGDIIVMESVLPDDWKIVEEAGALRLHIKHAAVKIYIDDALIYEYGYDRMAENKTVGSGFQFIDFPKAYEGKNICIEWCVAENEAFTKLDPIRIYEWANAYKALLTENRFPMFFGNFLVIFGICLMIITMFALLFSRKYIRMYCIAFFSFCMGLWTLCYYNVILVFSIPLYSISLLEYITLYLAPLPILIYLGENVKQLKYEFLKIIYWILFSVQVVFDVVIVLLHLMDIVHLASALKYMQLIIMCHLLYFTVVLFLSLKSSKITNRLYLIGVVIAGGCTAYDLLSYHQTRFSNGTFSPIKGVSCIGVMVLIFILILVFYVELTEKLMKETERNSLLRSAYTDELTQLHNRRYCSEYIEKISGEKCFDYTVVSFDLNNLKTINDTYGHTEGDVLIKSAADVIAETFEHSGIVGRMGGDEFIAILTTANREDVEGLMKKFADNIKRKNQTHDLNLSISYGYALSSELEEKNILKLYQMADSRMYNRKKEYKRGR